MVFQKIGFGARIRQIGVNQDFQQLEVDDVLQGYMAASRRMFFFDNEGTLSSDKGKFLREYGAPTGDVSDLKSHGTAPNEQVLECLRALCSDPKNTVVILSGRDHKKLDDWFGSVDRIGLAAEHGFLYKVPNVTGHQWQTMSRNTDFNWKSLAYEIMKQFVRRTQGSFIENKGSSLVWQYRDADHTFGSWQANELSAHLKELLFGFNDVDVINGKGYVEVKLRNINKGVAVEKVLSKSAKQFGEADFILCIGDDRSDEDMFEVLNVFIGDQNSDQADSASDGSSEKTSLSSSRLGGSQRHSLHGGLESKPKPIVGQSVGNLAAMAGGTSGGLSRTGGLSRKSFPNKNGQFSGCSDLSSLGGSGDSVGERRFFTVTVGKKPSAAKFFVNDVDEVSELLLQLKTNHERRSNLNTWSSGDQRGRVASMPALSTLNFGR